MQEGMNFKLNYVDEFTSTIRVVMFNLVYAYLFICSYNFIYADITVAEKKLLLTVINFGIKSPFTFVNY